MNRGVALLGGLGLGAGLMFLFDPRLGRRRRALLRDKAVHVAHEAEDAAGVVAHDLQNRARGLAHGDLSVLVGGKRALRHPLRGSWSPSARALMGLVGGGMFLYGLTRAAPAACVLGTVGLALAAEGVTNASLDDIAHLPQQMAGMACGAARSLGLGDHTAETDAEERAERTMERVSLPT